MSTSMYYVIIGAGILMLVGLFYWMNAKLTAPLNPSGYTYPSTAGA